MYFKEFPLVYYNFGSNEPVSLFQNISAYVDLVDQIADQINYYETYSIKDNERPDSLSYILYGDSQYYWTFYLLNEKLRVSGWPLTFQEFEKYIVTAYPHHTVTTQKDISTTLFKPGQIVTGSDTGVQGKILEVNLELGQIVVDTRGFVFQDMDEPKFRSFELQTEPETLRTFVDLSTAPFMEDGHEVVTIISAAETNPTFDPTSVNIRQKFRLQGNKLFLSDDEFLTAGVTQLFVSFRFKFFANNNFDPNESITIGTRGTDLVDAPLIKAQKQFNSTAYFENTSGERVDIFSPTTGLPDYNLTTGLIPITYKDRARLKNDSLKTIKILKPDVVGRVAQEFNKLLDQ